MLVSKKTVYVGADIVTMSEKAPKAEAVCIADGRIECVGTREEVLGYAKAGEYDVVDFGGGTLYPGFIDTHSHMSSFSRCLNQVYCGASLGSIAAVQQALRDKAAASDDEWVIGYGYDDSGISDNRHMNRHDLDAVCAETFIDILGACGKTYGVRQYHRPRTSWFHRRYEGPRRRDRP